MHASGGGMGREAMRPKTGKLSNGGKGPKPKHPRNANAKLKRKHRIRKFTKKLRRQS